MKKATVLIGLMILGLTAGSRESEMGTSEIADIKLEEGCNFDRITCPDSWEQFESAMGLTVR